MGRVTIRKKCITIARKAMRSDSTARVDGKSIFIKRYPGHNYKLIMVHVTKKQRAVRDMFADANVLAKEDMKRWNRVRHWERYARQHKKLGAYRAAVSYYYKMIREHGKELREIRLQSRREKGFDNRGVDMRVFKEKNVFFWVKFESVDEYMGALERLAG
ncbi:MAG: hypothetical protein MJZ31_02895 [Bacteroidales bacterium]|nr:hypothetical protein [Bacteroidales bacterium]